ncbi:DUF2784 domain-containing protein [Candidatus Pacearchaeota archaeon]|nr:DUF2784 domain-containing protein [Candidatus Pacearchaeota archaeon]
MDRKRYLFWAEVVEKAHILVMILYILSVAALIFGGFRIMGASYIIFVWLVEAAYGGKCPLTVQEKKLRRFAGQKVGRHQFLSTLFLVNTPWSCHGDKASSKNINA